jgi:hypothetical protein
VIEEGNNVSTRSFALDDDEKHLFVYRLTKSEPICRMGRKKNLILVSYMNARSPPRWKDGIQKGVRCSYKIVFVFLMNLKGHRVNEKNLDVESMGINIGGSHYLVMSISK